ncbi:MAG: hypothetical protein S4CHLAM123_02700 [Chlamydiales bacterium]|nr:hypothetical protein [Chlamydiales bacterium]
MKLRFVLIFFSFFISFFIPLQASQSRLSSENVQEVMEKLFEYHIDQKEINTALMQRSLKIYLKNFDPSRSYLLETEAFPYIHPSKESLQKAVYDFQNDRFTIYFALNQQIQDSIERARSWRAQWEQDPIQLVEDAKKTQLQKNKVETYAKTPAELKQRHYDRFVEFLGFHIQELNLPSTAGLEAKLVALSEKQIAQMENGYLGIDEERHTLSAADQEHLVILHTIKALAHSLDAHTAYYSPEEAYAMKVQLEKGMCGIGVVLREGVDGITIQELIVGGPAEKSGRIMAGDTIVEVDGESVQGVSFSRVLEIMKGKEGSKTVLGVVRSGNLSHVELTRARIVLADKRVDVEAEPYGEGIIGKITLHSFYEGEDGLSSEKDLKKAIDELKAQGPLYGLVLDMRDNGGGFLSQAVKVSGLFISSGVVVISKYSDGSMKYYRAVDGSRYYDGPLVVLISRGSASATEIVAQTLKDYGVAIVVGDEQTYGKGTIQHQTVTNDRMNSFFKVTIGKYYTVSGKSTQIEGVKADIFVPSEFNYEEIGEAYLEYPVTPDWVESAYIDTLADIDPYARKWFQKYYVPSIQQKQLQWDGLLPILRANSAKRVEQNKNYQLFIEQIKEQIEPLEEISFGVNDLQMDESVNILKDMILITEGSAEPQSAD